MAAKLGLVVALTLAASIGAIAQEAPDELEYRYESGFAATGAFEGACALAGYRMSDGEAGAWRLHHAGGSILVAEARLNYTSTADVQYEMEDHEVRHARYDLPPGDLEISWPKSGHVHAWGSGEAFAGLEGVQWDVGPTSRHFAAGPAYFREDDEGRLVRHEDPGVGPGRLVETGQHRVPVRGSLNLVAMEALFRQQGVEVQLPRHEWVEDRDGGVPLVVAKRTWVEVHATVDLRDVTTTLDAARGDLVCSGLAWRGQGDVHFRSATGQARVADERHEFSQRELTLSGTIDAVETVEASDPEGGGDVWSAGQATGDFSALGLDFQSVIVKPAPAPDFVQVGFWALLGGLLVALLSQFSRLVGLFYTRVDESTALKHPLRQQLLDLVRARPGLIHNDAVAATRQPRGVVRHHVRVLETVGLIRSLRTGKEIHLYPRNTNLAAERRSLILERNAPVRFLVDRVRTGPLPRWRASRDLQERFGVSRMGAWKTIRRALNEGLLQGRKDTRAGEVLEPGPSVGAAVRPAPSLETVAEASA